MIHRRIPVYPPARLVLSIIQMLSGSIQLLAISILFGDANTDSFNNPSPLVAPSPW